MISGQEALHRLRNVEGDERHPGGGRADRRCRRPQLEVSDPAADGPGTEGGPVRGLLSSTAVGRGGHGAQREGDLGWTPVGSAWRCSKVRNPQTHRFKGTKKLRLLYIFHSMGRYPTNQTLRLAPVR